MLLHRLALGPVLRSSGCISDDTESLEIQMASFSLMHTPLHLRLRQRQHGAGSSALANEF